MHFSYNTDGQVTAVRIGDEDVSEKIFDLVEVVTGEEMPEFKAELLADPEMIPFWYHTISCISRDGILDLSAEALRFQRWLGSRMSGAQREDRKGRFSIPLPKVFQVAAAKVIDGRRWENGVVHAIADIAA
jgi:hypothetical protein